MSTLGRHNATTPKSFIETLSSTSHPHLGDDLTELVPGHEHQLMVVSLHRKRQGKEESKTWCMKAKFVRVWDITNTCPSIYWYPKKAHAKDGQHVISLAQKLELLPS
eukprot:1155329-Pelagomonas_calceolata.AAC.1